MGRVAYQERLAANPEKAHTRDAPRTSTASGMPNAMLAHIPTVAQGFLIVLFSAVAICSSVKSAGNSCRLTLKLYGLVRRRDFLRNLLFKLLPWHIAVEFLVHGLQELSVG